MRALLILECEKNQREDFKFCRGVKNVILDLEKIRTHDDYLKVIEYLDTMGIFDGVCNKAHKISNIIYKIYGMGLINDRLYEDISYFYKMHVRCNMVLYLEPKI